MTKHTDFTCVLRAWEAHEKELLAFLISHTRDSHLADDLLQTVFLKSIRQGQGFCTLKNPRAWLFQVARNALIDTARLNKPHVELSEESVASATFERPPVDELDSCVVHNLQAMAADDRHIIAACDLQGQTVYAYAKAHQLSLAAAKSRLLRARKRLRDHLIQNCQVHFDESGKVCCHVPRTTNHELE
ncbi:sigma-70 family RNA polymerase sigma factor [Celerinatantimonas yamalensis]|uniref:RNA polymerase sigma factor n=1 Tax=Celerinatantimonas yamalensis TaxID=559956 RepID=A0ABW9G916_9GAMM